MVEFLHTEFNAWWGWAGRPKKQWARLTGLTEADIAAFSSGQAEAPRSVVYLLQALSAMATPDGAPKNPAAHLFGLELLEPFEVLGLESDEYAIWQAEQAAKKLSTIYGDHPKISTALEEFRRINDPVNLFNF